MRDSPTYKKTDTSSSTKSTINVEVSGMMVVFFHDFVMTVRKVKKEKEIETHTIVK